MEKSCAFTSFAEIDCSYTNQTESGMATLLFPADKEGLFLTDASALADNPTWDEAEWLWFDAVNSGPPSMALTLSFWDADNLTDTPDLVSTIGLLPGLPTRVSFPLAALDSQRMFLNRTPGKLKTVIHGNKVRSLARFAIGRKKCSDTQTLSLGALHLSSAEPDYPLPQTPLLDAMGQWTNGTWPDKMPDAATMTASMKTRLSANASATFFPDWTDSGALRAKRFEATGFFRTHHDGTRWWLADPEGYAFYSIGVDCVRPGDGMNVKGIRSLTGPLPEKEGLYQDAWPDRLGPWRAELFDSHVANLIAVFGAQWREAWRDMTRANLANWGFNTVGNWSLPAFTEQAGLPYVLPMAGFPTTETRIFRDFPDVFSPEYKQNAEAFAEQMRPLREDRHLIGYFLRNEPEWAFIKELNIAEELLESEGESMSREAFIRFVADKYLGEIERLNEVWGTTFTSFDAFRSPIMKARRFTGAIPDLVEFSRMMVDRYVRIPSKAVRAVDPNHLNLGMRYGYLSSDDLLAGSDCFDVFSINCYDIDPRDAIEKAGKATNLPVMIGEFHFGALDRGLSATGIRGADGQTERGHAYRRYAELAASSPWCVGTHYFQYNDQPALGRFDGENYNIGLIDVCQTPHHAFLKVVTTCHKQMYEVALGRRAPYDTPARLIHPIFF